MSELLKNIPEVYAVKDGERKLAVTFKACFAYKMRPMLEKLGYCAVPITFKEGK